MRAVFAHFFGADFAVAARALVRRAGARLAFLRLAPRVREAEESVSPLPIDKALETLSRRLVNMPFFGIVIAFL